MFTYSIEKVGNRYRINKSFFGLFSWKLPIEFRNKIQAKNHIKRELT